MLLINDICKEQGITQKELAEKIGITPVGLNKAINGNPTKTTLEKVAKALNVKVSDLFAEDEEPKKEKILVAKFGSDKTPLHLGNLEIPCYVLEDGTRVFSGRGIQKVLNKDRTSAAWLSPFVNKAPLTMRFSDGENSVIERINNPIKFKRPGAGGSQSVTYGYEVTILIDICSGIIEANRDGEFDDEIIVRNADLIIRSVAKTGIIALVDEVTGYDKEKTRAKDELQKFLKQFISQEASRWVKVFDDSFFEMIYKMRNWTWTQTNKRPGVIGKWIDDIVYQRIAPLILAELKKANPKNESGNRSFRHHQFLTKEVGLPKLKEHLAAVQALGRVSGYKWDVFMKMLDVAYPKQYQQMEIDFDFDDVELVSIDDK